MRQPGVDRACPLAQVELRKELLVHRLQGCQDLANFFTGVSCDLAEWVQFVETAAKLKPGRIRLVERLLERDGVTAPSRNQT